MQPDSLPPPNLDLERDWFWTGVPAGFIIAVVALLAFLLAGIWAGLVVGLLLFGAGAVWSNRDGGQCRAMFMLGSLMLLVPSVIVGLVIRHFALN